MRVSDWLHETAARLGPHGSELVGTVVALLASQLEGVRGEGLPTET